MQVTHRPYGSIENIINQKFIRLLHQQQKHKGEWVVTEKIHGANFCIIISADGNISCSRRKSLLTEKEFFYNWKFLREKYRDDALMIHEELTKDLTEEEKNEISVRIYGELYGGYYPTLGTEGDCVRVQKGIYYAPYNDFIVFDICAKKMIDYDRMTELCNNTTFRVTAPLARGSFEEVFSYDPLFESTLPAILGMEKMEDNIAEGVVIKPVKPDYLLGGQRVIIKKKNERFAEITGMSKAKAKKPRQNVVPYLPEAHSPEFGTAFEEFRCYVNANRLESVISKIGEVTLAERAKLSGLLARDALEDFVKLSTTFEALPPREQKLFKKSVGVACHPVVEEYFNTL